MLQSHHLRKEIIPRSRCASFARPVLETTNTLLKVFPVVQISTPILGPWSSEQAIQWTVQGGDPDQDGLRCYIQTLDLLRSTGKRASITNQYIVHFCLIANQYYRHLYSNSGFCTPILGSEAAVWSCRVSAAPWRHALDDGARL